MIELHPCTLQQAWEFVREHHRHLRKPDKARFAIAGLLEGQLVAVAIVGNPVARGLCDGVTAEVRRLCVSDAAPRNSCSRLLRACWRAWSAMGGRRMVTYTLPHEGGASLRGAGFRLVGITRAQEWSTPSRPRRTQPVYALAKHRWEVAA